MKKPIYRGPNTEHLSLFSSAMSYLEKHFFIQNRSDHFRALRLDRGCGNLKLNMFIPDNSSNIAIVFETSLTNFSSWFSLPSEQPAFKQMCAVYAKALSDFGADSIQVEQDKYGEVVVRVLMSSFNPELLSHIMDCAEIPKRVKHPTFKKNGGL